jgi:hypothetical protein
MGNTLDSKLFEEIILSEGAMHLYSCNRSDFNNKYFTGPSGKKVLICLEDEDIPFSTIKGYLTQLGMEDLIDRLLG